jgi:hypothetical protein
MVLASCGLNLSPGSYPYAETYTIDISEEKLIGLINKFEENNPEYKVPDVTIDSNNYFKLKNGRSGNDDYWYHFYFYYTKENSIVHIWTRPLSKEVTTVAFVGVNEGLTLGHWKLINKDFEKSENSKEIKKFEERILDPIRQIK